MKCSTTKNGGGHVPFCRQPRVSRLCHTLGRRKRNYFVEYSPESYVFTPTVHTLSCLRCCQGAFVLGTQYPVPSTQYPVPSTQYPVPSTQYPVPSTQYPVPSTQYPVPSTQYPVPSTQYPVPSTQYPVPSTQYPVPSTQYPVPSTQYPVPSTQYPVPKNNLGDLNRNAKTTTAGLCDPRAPNLP